MLDVPRVEIVRVPPHLVMSAWPMFQRAFRRAQGTSLGDRMDELAILQGLCDGSKELLVAKDADAVGGVIIEFVQRPKGKCCIVVVSLFDRFHRHAIPQWTRQVNRYIAQYAKDECGCYAIEAYARDGVAPALSQLGWRRKAIVMEMKL